MGFLKIKKLLYVKITHVDFVGEKQLSICPADANKVKGVQHLL